MVLEKLRKPRKKTVDEDYIVALDIGTEFVKALIAKPVSNNRSNQQINARRRMRLW